MMMMMMMMTLFVENSGRSMMKLLSAKKPTSTYTKENGLSIVDQLLLITIGLTTLVLEQLISSSLEI